MWCGSNHTCHITAKDFLVRIAEQILTKISFFKKFPKIKTLSKVHHVDYKNVLCNGSNVKIKILSSFSNHTT